MVWPSADMQSYLWEVVEFFFLFFPKFKQNSPSYLSTKKVVVILTSVYFNMSTRSILIQQWLSRRFSSLYCLPHGFLFFFIVNFFLLCAFQLIKLTRLTFCWLTCRCHSYATNKSEVFFILVTSKFYFVLHSTYSSHIYVDCKTMFGKCWSRFSCS